LHINNDIYREDVILTKMQDICPAGRLLKGRFPGALTIRKKHLFLPSDSR